MVRALVLLGLLLPFAALAQEAPGEVEGALTVNAYQAKRLHDLGAVFVDVRSGREWAWGHVRGALHLDFATGLASLAGSDLPRSVPLVIYCDSEFCAAGAQATRMAVEWGYRQVFYLRDGYFAWQLEDFPLEKGGAADYATFSAQAH